MTLLAELLTGWLLAAAPAPAGLPPEAQAQAVAALGDPSMKVRLQAALALGRASPAAQEPLVRALLDSDFPVRAAAARSLGHVGDAQAIEPLLQRLDDGEPFVQEQARLGLQGLLERGLGPDVARQRMRASAHGRAQLALPAARAAAGAGDVLMGLLLADADAGVRDAARAAINGLPPPEAQRLLLGQLAAPTVPARIAAAQLCGERKQSGALRLLIAMLVSPSEPGESQEAARQALRAMRDQLDEPRWRGRAKAGPQTGQVEALAVLAALGGEENVQVHLDALDDPDLGVRSQAALGLLTMKQKAAVPRLSVLAGRAENAPIQRILDSVIRELAK